MNAMEINEIKFVKLSRLNKQLVLQLIEKLTPDLQAPSRSSAISIETKVWGNRMAPLTAEEVRRRFEALESRQEATLEELKCSNEKVAYWMERAERAEKLLQPSCQEPASEESGSESEAAEGPAEAAAPPAALKEGQGPVTDSSDGEGFETQNRRRKRKRTRPMSSSEEEANINSLSTGV
ncbi:uncharacterized protein LOC125503745, partial [Dendroctonus ponderosae]|uniref:uncharacterized protein LOC125503745 n=1 Tax=Dendroctonus ponderosae TaxID=77166 RepID=UPI0020351FFE